MCEEEKRSVEEDRRAMEKELWKSERIERWERIEKDNRTMKLTLGVKKSELEA